ncbi:hypothetical protein LF65_05701 [Clostridium beijerinckii]|uniref:HTH cro/C1-type domain-containing protein n=1 Tax=Clostridium beijerinckii TaxID=1520 RepID=A0A0B5QW84_CLOBE|nr:helix-turn-helix transcriptional regulator [Clostridium beijerinckii]AJH02208.1 hypothetical protein LF65_05701 [Clostridium beijerinckii]
MENIFARRMKEIRVSKNLTQQQLADFINDENLIEKKVSRASITRYENGTRTPDYATLAAIGIALNVDTDYLIGKSDKRHFEITNVELSDFVDLISNIINKDNAHINDKLWKILSDLNDLIDISIKHNFLDNFQNMIHFISMISNRAAHNNNIESIANLEKCITDYFKLVAQNSFKKSMREFIPEILNKAELHGISQLYEHEIDILKKFYFGCEINEIPYCIKDIFTENQND